MKTPALVLSPAFLSVLLSGSGHAAVTPFAEYRLGEPGSLAGTQQLPQDSSGNNRHVTQSINGNTVGVLTSAVTAPGSTHYLDTRAASPDQGWYSSGNLTGLATDNFAVGVYASAPATGNGDVISLGGSNGAFKLSVGSNGWAASSHNIAWIGTPGGIPGSLKPNQWVHLALVRKSGTTTFYIDGVPQATYGGTPVHNSLHFTVSPGGGGYFNGRIDEARIVTFDPADTLEDIFAVLGAPPLPIRQLIRDGENSYPAVALAAGLTSEVRPGIGAGRDFTIITDPDALTVAGPHTLKVLTQPGLQTGVPYDLFQFTSAGVPTLDPDDFELDLPEGVSATLALDSSQAPTYYLTLNFDDLGDRIWNGTAGVGGAVWDDSSTNWLDPSGTPVTFGTGDSPRFSDDAVVKNVAVAAGGVAPANLRFTALDDYFLTGPGTINASGSALLEGGKVSLSTALSAAGSIDLLPGATLELLPGGGAAATLIQNGGTLALSPSASLALATPVSGGSIVHGGSGQSTLSGAVAAASLDVQQGLLVLAGGVDVSSQNIAAGATLELNAATAANHGSTFITGPGTLRKTGPADLTWPGSSATFALADGGLIDVQEGTFIGGSNANEVWTNNEADLHVAAGAVFNGVEATVTVDAISGAGTILSGYPGFGSAGIVCGVAGGSGDFSGSIGNGPVPGAVGRLTKRGNGTQTLSGANTYSGNTTVEEGTLVLSSTGSLRFTPGASGVSNRITGTGSVTLDGSLEILLNGASTIAGSTWNLVDVNTLGEDYGDDFQVTGFTETSAGVWQLSGGGLRWTFTESSGNLDVAVAAGYQDWADIHAGGQGAELDHDQDGVPNGIEYFLGETGSGFTALPAPVTSGGLTTVTWPRDPAAEVASFQVETSDSLEGGWSPAPEGQVDLSDPAQVVYTFPAPLTGKRFVRLAVTP
jgi:autotransporter-associated beta strand protein